jgi:hypothetical protein
LPFGEEVEGYAFPVLNEREIRASAGILFLALFVSLTMILFEQDFLLVKYVIVVFLTDFIVRVFVSPRYSPTLIIGRFIVRRQVPEYVGAAQKKFAWKIGLVLSGLMFFLLVVINSYSILTGITCLVCLLFLFFESSFGICAGCWFYRLFYKDEAVGCAGANCAETKQQPIQKISWVQLVIVIVAVVYILLTVAFFNDYFRIAPRSLRDIVGLL